MKNNKILFELISRNDIYFYQIDRNEFYDKMKYFAETYEQNNEITQFLEILPKLKLILINEKSNLFAQVPYVIYVLDEEVGRIKINRNHIIWNELDHYCEKAKNKIK